MESSCRWLRRVGEPYSAPLAHRREESRPRGHSVSFRLKTVALSIGAPPVGPRCRQARFHSLQVAAAQALDPRTRTNRLRRLPFRKFSLKNWRTVDRRAAGCASMSASSLPFTCKSRPRRHSTRAPERTASGDWRSVSFRLQALTEWWCRRLACTNAQAGRLCHHRPSHSVRRF
jgi:hypothetical protein